MEQIDWGRLTLFEGGFKYYMLYTNYFLLKTTFWSLIGLHPYKSKILTTLRDDLNGSRETPINFSFEVDCCQRRSDLRSFLMLSSIRALFKEKILGFLRLSADITFLVIYLCVILDKPTPLVVVTIRGVLVVFFNKQMFVWSIMDHNVQFTNE